MKSERKMNYETFKAHEQTQIIGKNSGFTLLSFVIVMAIMVLVSLAVAGFIGNESTKQYKYASKGRRFIESSTAYHELIET